MPNPVNKENFNNFYNFDIIFSNNIMKNPVENINDLKGGKIAEVMAYYMLEKTNDQKMFLKIVSENKGKFNNILSEFESFYGYKPSPEFIELEECLSAYNEMLDNIHSDRLLVSNINETKKYLLKAKIDDLINDYEFIFTILTGMLHFGMNPSQNIPLVTTLPNLLNTPLILDDDMICYSISDYIIYGWEEIYDEDGDEYNFENTDGDDRKISGKVTSEVKKIIEDFSNEAEELLNKRQYYHNQDILFDRTQWIHEHTQGKISSEFNRAIKKAPDFATWEKEKELVGKEPVISNYWLLAHFFLGNTKACKECIELSKKTPGMVTKELSIMIKNALDNNGKPGFKLGNLKGNELNNIISISQQKSPEKLKEKKGTV